MEISGPALGSKVSWNRCSYPNVSLLEYALAFSALCQDAHSSAMATAQVLFSFRSLLSIPGGEVFNDLPV